MIRFSDVIDQAIQRSREAFVLTQRFSHLFSFMERIIIHGLAGVQATGAELWRPCHVVLLVGALSDMGQLEEGLKTLAGVLTMVDTTRVLLTEPELRRLQGELALQQ